MNALLLIVLAALMHATRSFTAGGEPGTAGTSLALGYLILSAFLGGRIAAALRLPKLTGYLAVGVFVGPSALGLLSQPMIESLTLVNGMAISLIALTAGSELDLRAMKPLMRSIAGISLVGVLGTTLLLALAVWLLRGFIPSLAELDGTQSLAISLVLGVVIVAQSPAVVVALRDEMRADGPVMRTALGVVVLADLLVIFLFTVASTLAKAALGGGADLSEAFATFGWEIVGSLASGAAVGALLSVYFKRIREGRALFLLAITFISAEVGGRLHLDPLLTALSAGMFVRNVSDIAPVLEEHIHASSLPVYVLFFAVAGANIHLDALAQVWLPAVTLVAVRGTGLLFGSRLGARLAGAPDTVRRFAGFGLLPQAGLALALSMLLIRTFPELGPEAGGLTLGIVALNELLAPAIFRAALIRSGEAGKGAEAPDDSGELPEPAQG
jgi:Kef-type K+ transport system membrane component KefB